MLCFYLVVKILLIFNDMLIKFWKRMGISFICKVLF